MAILTLCEKAVMWEYALLFSPKSKKQAYLRVGAGAYAGSPDVWIPNRWKMAVFELGKKARVW